MKPEKMMKVFIAALFTVLLTGCGDTWQGLKKDTGENLEAAGEAVEKAGKKIKE